MLELRCTKCGGPMPPIKMDDVERALSSRAGLELICGSCSEPDHVEPDGRHFELVVSLVEVLLPPEEGAVGSREELMEFRARTTAPTLDAAMRPLAEEFGAQWMRAEAVTHIADAPEEGG